MFTIYITLVLISFTFIALFNYFHDETDCWLEKVSLKHAIVISLFAVIVPVFAIALSILLLVVWLVQTEAVKYTGYSIYGIYIRLDKAFRRI